jgi:hypothetical protein
MAKLGLSGIPDDSNITPSVLKIMDYCSSVTEGDGAAGEVVGECMKEYYRANTVVNKDTLLAFKKSGYQVVSADDILRLMLTNGGTEDASAYSLCNWLAFFSFIGAKHLQYFSTGSEFDCLAK